MKRALSLLLCALLAFGLCACAAPTEQTDPASSPDAAPQPTPVEDAGGLYAPGTYTGSAPGRNGEITVEVTVTADAIESVAVTGHSETAGISDPAIETLPEAIVAAQSTGVDAVAGATITSEGILAAVESALAAARGEEAGPAAVSTEADVVVLGAGGAGLAAGAAAGEAGASVIILEANSYAGGATISSGGHMLYVDDAFNAAQPRNDADLQKYLNYDPAGFGEWANDLLTLQQQVEDYLNNGEPTGRFDSVERVLVDHFVAGSGADREGNAVSLDYQLIKDAALANMEIYDWLRGAGMEIADTLYKDHANSPVGGGSGLVAPLLALAENAGCNIQYNTRATELVVEDGRVVGAKATGPDGVERTYTAKGGVVIATGGFASNPEMVAKYQNYGLGLNENVGSSNPPTSRGDGILMAEALGAAVRDLQFISTVFMGYQNGCTLAEAGKILGTQQLILNAEGKRFTDESSNSGVQSALNDQTEGLAYLVGDAKMIDALNAIEEGYVEDLIGRGWVYRADTVEEAAELAGLDPAVAAESVAQFNSFVDAGSDPDFGRTAFNGKVEEGPFLVAKMAMHYHLTFGGLVVDPSTRVLDTAGNALPGLYAAGDVLSGFEGDVHQSGDCLTIVVYTGKVAGEQAAAEAAAR